MKVTIKEFIKPTHPLQEGDIITHAGETFVVINEGNGYIARSLDGRFGMTGRHSSLHSLYRSIVSLKEATIYSQLEFDFELIIKHKGDL